ncbi:MAG TPA: nicotinate-nucleotide adenylyltransferase [Blastocatellia bacterium]|nr:nicotinate-nucleotide adenylyltransferase [Blastocatellia bacterium]
MALSLIGVYGGTFDPIHNGHVKVAKDALTLFAVDRLLLIPAAIPPHKRERTITDAHHRYAMVVLATEDEPRLEASLIEIERPDLPYSVQTVARLKDQYELASTEIFFLIGADSFAELHTWREPMKLIENCHLVVTTRPGYELDLSATPAEWQRRIVDLRNDFIGGREYNETKIFLTGLTWIDISATDIRDAVQTNRPIDKLVPPRVAKYIKKYRLYRK